MYHIVLLVPGVGAVLIMWQVLRLDVPPVVDKEGHHEHNIEEEGTDQDDGKSEREEDGLVQDAVAVVDPVVWINESQLDNFVDG